MAEASLPIGVDLWSPPERARVVRLCTAIVGERAEAEDLAHEAMLLAWQLRHRLDPATDPRGARAWLDAITRNVCRRWMRSRAAAPLPTADLVEGEACDLDSVLEREELVELLDRALGLLPPVTRSALVGHYVEELSHAQIAQRIGTSPDAVSMRITRGRRALRHALETTFRDDALAEGWVRRDDVGWRTTRLMCVECGTTGVQLRHDAAEVAFRCPTCDPDGLAVRIPLDVPAFAAVLAGVRRPSALMARISTWTRGYWPGEVHRCVRCGRQVQRRTYRREQAPQWSTRHGWWVSCVCGQQVSGSVAGLALALPQVADARRREPRLRALPIRDVVRDGAPAKVVAYGTAQGPPLVSAVFLRDSLRLVHVD